MRVDCAEAPWKLPRLPDVQAPPPPPPPPMPPPPTAAAQTSLEKVLGLPAGAYAAAAAAQAHRPPSHQPTIGAYMASRSSAGQSPRASASRSSSAGAAAGRAQQQQHKQEVPQHPPAANEADEREGRRQRERAAWCERSAQWSRRQRELDEQQRAARRRAARNAPDHQREAQKANIVSGRVSTKGQPMNSRQVARLAASMSVFVAAPAAPVQELACATTDSSHGCGPPLHPDAAEPPLQPRPSPTPPPLTAPFSSPTCPTPSPQLQQQQQHQPACGPPPPPLHQPPQLSANSLEGNKVSGGSGQPTSSNARRITEYIAYWRAMNAYLERGDAPSPDDVAPEEARGDGHDGSIESGSGGIGGRRLSPAKLVLPYQAPHALPPCSPPCSPPGTDDEEVGNAAATPEAAAHDAAASDAAASVAGVVDAPTASHMPVAGSPTGHMPKGELSVNGSDYDSDDSADLSGDEDDDNHRVGGPSGPSMDAGQSRAGAGGAVCGSRLLGDMLRICGLPYKSKAACALMSHILRRALGWHGTVERDPLMLQPPVLALDPHISISRCIGTSRLCHRPAIKNVAKMAAMYLGLGVEQVGECLGTAQLLARLLGALELWDDLFALQLVRPRPTIVAFSASGGRLSCHQLVAVLARYWSQCSGNSRGLPEDERDRHFRVLAARREWRALRHARAQQGQAREEENGYAYVLAHHLLCEWHATYPPTNSELGHRHLREPMTVADGVARRLRLNHPPLCGAGGEPNPARIAALLSRCLSCRERRCWVSGDDHARYQNSPVPSTAEGDDGAYGPPSVRWAEEREGWAEERAGWAEDRVGEGGYSRSQLEGPGTDPDHHRGPAPEPDHHNRFGWLPPELVCAIFDAVRSPASHLPFPLVLRALDPTRCAAA